MIHITLVFSLPRAMSSLSKKNLLSKSINITKKNMIPVFLKIDVTPETVLERREGMSIPLKTLSYKTHLSILKVVSKELTMFWSLDWYSGARAMICWIFEFIIQDITENITKYVKSERKNDNTLGIRFFWKNQLSESIANDKSTAIIKGISIPAPIYRI